MPGLLRRQREAAQRQLPGQHLVEDDAQRVDVGPVIDLQRPLHLLRGHVVQRAHHLPRPGQREVAGVAAQQLGQAEVGDLHAALAVQQDVLRLDVAVDDALLVGVLQGVADLRHDPQRLLRLQVAVAQQLPQVDAVHVLHDEVVEAAGLAEIVDGDDVGMAEPGQGAGLAVEALGEGGVAAGLAAAAP